MIALSLWVSLPSGDPEITVLRNALGDFMGLGPPAFMVSSVLKVLPLSAFCPPLPIGSVYVGAGNDSFGLKPSAWLNPFDYVDCDVNPLEGFVCFSRARPDLMNWLMPLSKASVVVCDCVTNECACHASVLMDLLHEKSDKEASREKVDERLMECGLEEGPEDAPEEDEVEPLARNETTRGFDIGANVGYPESWTRVVSAVRGAPQRIFWEIFAGCAI